MNALQRLGTLTTSEDREYTTSRRVWNGSIDSHPSCILHPSTPTSLSTALSTASSALLSVSVRGGGHSVRGLGVAPNTLCLHLAHMDGVEYDSSSHRVAVGGGATWAQVDSILSPHGRAVPAGLISHTGVGGLTLGGGVGWCTRVAGLTLDALVGAQVATVHHGVINLGVLADQKGALHDELWWGIKSGMGSNFGVVTQFVFDTFPIPSAGNIEVHLALSESTLEAVISAFARWMGGPGGVPDHVVPYVFVVGGDGMGDGLIFVSISVLGGDSVELQSNAQVMEAARPVLDDLEALGGIVASMGIVSIRELNAKYDQGNPHGKHYRWSSSTLLDVDALSVSAGTLASQLVALSTGPGAAGLGPGLNTSIELTPLGGSATRSASSNKGENADVLHPLRSARAEVHGIVSWEPENARDGDANVAARGWTAQLSQAMRVAATNPTGPRGYFNTDGSDGDPDGEGGLEASPVWDRLVACKMAYDPHNVLSSNRNIIPSGTPSSALASPRLTPEAFLAARDAELDSALEGLEGLEEGGSEVEDLRTSNMWPVWIILNVLAVMAIAYALHITS